MLFETFGTVIFVRFKTWLELVLDMLGGFKKKQTCQNLIPCTLVVLDYVCGPKMVYGLKDNYEIFSFMQRFNVSN